MAAPVVETMYWLPYCSTCTKAEQHLLNLGVTIGKQVNVKEEKVSKEILQQLADALGGVSALFSKRAMKYRSMGLDKRELTDEEMLQFMHDEYTFIKRPVIQTKEGKVLAGFSAKQYDALFNA